MAQRGVLDLKEHNEQVGTPHLPVLPFMFKVTVNWTASYRQPFRSPSPPTTTWLSRTFWLTEPTSTLVTFGVALLCTSVPRKVTSSAFRLETPDISLVKPDLSCHFLHAGNLDDGPTDPAAGGHWNVQLWRYLFYFSLNLSHSNIL